MNLKDIRYRLETIRRVASDGDDARAHEGQDRLLMDFAEFVAAEAPEPFCSAAKEVLKVKKIEYSRWFE